jgi:argininosuccinate synthase
MKSNGILKVALAYSGGLDTSVIIPWLRETYGCQVVAVVADVGQSDDLAAVHAKALASGALDCHVVDLRATFARHYVFPALRAGALYEGRYLLGTALARPLIAAAQVQVARATGCDALAHGATGKGNDQVRFELAYQALAPDLAVIAPWREWHIRSREDAVAYARERGIPVPVTPARPYSVDQNLLHTSYEGGILEDPATPAPPGMCTLTADPEQAPDVPEEVVVGFEAGIPVSVDGVNLAPHELLAALNARAGAHGVGRVDMVENRLVGLKSRGVYETPGGTVLHAALRDLESLTQDRDTLHYQALLAQRYSELVYYGQWFAPLRDALDAFMAAAHQHVTGSVTVRLFKGACQPVARTAPRSLYRQDLATFGDDGAYDHRDAAGFIHLWGLPTRVHAAVHGVSADLPEVAEVP